MTEPRTAVYRFFDHDGALLYVGITADLFARWRWHEKNADWWDHQSRIEVVWHADRASADAEETAAVRSESALHNLQKRGKTPLRSVRLPDEIWVEFGTAAEAMGSNRTDVLRQFMQWFVGRPEAELPPRPSSGALTEIRQGRSA